jgi:hypothetical protein
MMKRHDSGGFLGAAFGNENDEYSDDEFLLIDDEHSDDKVCDNVTTDPPLISTEYSPKASQETVNNDSRFNDEPVVTMEPVRFDTDGDKKPTRKKSCMKKSSSYGCLTDGIPISVNKNSYSALPMPDMDMIRSVSMSSFFHEATPRNSGRVKRNVSFSNISMRNYPLTLGDNPSVSCGPPTTLDWEFEEAEELSLDDYENNRAPRRKPREMLLNYYQRKAILENSGHSEEEIKRARRQAERSKRQRNTTKEMVQFMRVEDAVQSVGRTTKRALKKSNSTESLME